MVKTDPTRDDKVKVAVLEFLHKKRSTAKSVDGAKVGIMELRKALKAKGMGQNEVVKNLLYLIEAQYVNAIVQQKQIKLQRGFFPKPSEKYMITNEGMEFFDEDSQFSRKDVLAGINIQNVSGVVNFGNNNIIRNEAINLYKALEELENKVRVTEQLSDEEKLNYRADIKTIQDQLPKPIPNKSIIRSASSVLGTLAKIGSLTLLAERVTSMLNQMGLI